ncbi:MAG: undecaprenyl-diphosphate phosphatase [Pseudomonadota bacterium]|nr:undecaprenyl-diphosphate phosphatase [Pseudomonadota bacterium]
MNSLEIFIYSLVQGITEFLPISSSAHLYILEQFLDLNVNGLSLALAAHLGTLLAVLLYERKAIFSIIYSEFFSKKKDGQFISLLFCVIPVLFAAFCIIFFFKESYKFSVTSIALASILGALLLDYSDKRKKLIKKEKLSIKDSIFIGIFHIFSLIPGMSRSGTIITAARFYGYSRSFSIKLALLTSVPIISIASLYGIYQTFVLDVSVNYYFFFVTILTFLFSFTSIKLLVRWISFFSFRIFVFYRLCFGVFLLVIVNFKF